MAVPSNFTTLNISGKFVNNKIHSDDISEILRLQGVGWMLRKGISLATHTLHIKHYQEEGLERIDFDQTLTGGIKGTSEERILSWKEIPHEDYIFGRVLAKSRRAKTGDLESESEFLKKGWTEETLADGLIHSHAYSDASKNGRAWTARQTWGVEVVDGQERFVRRIDFTGPKNENVRCRLVYDYAGKAPADKQRIGLSTPLPPSSSLRS